MERSQLKVLVWISVIFTFALNVILVVSNDESPLLSHVGDPVENAFFTRIFRSPHPNEKAHAHAVCLETILILTISAVNLRPESLYPGCITYIMPYESEKLMEYHRTEIIMQNNNPEFESKVVIPYSLVERKAALKFSFYNRQYTHRIGFAEYELSDAEEMQAHRFKVKLKLKPDFNYFKSESYAVQGHIILLIEKVINSNYNEVMLRLSGKDIDTGHFSVQSSGVYIEISKRLEEKPTPFALVARTEVKRLTTNPEWSPITMPVKLMYTDNGNRELEFTCWECNEDGERKLIGEFRTTFDEVIKQENAERAFDLMHPQKESKTFGKILVSDGNISEIPSFADFIKNGLRVHFAIAIDFAFAKAKYAEAIKSIVPLIEDFNYDKSILVKGFGTRFKPNIKVDWVPTNNLEGVLEIYHALRKGVEDPDSRSPTYFDRIISDFVKTMRASHDNYFVLIILTPGQMIPEIVELTEKVLSDASKLPISIIVVSSPSTILSKTKELGKSYGKSRHDIVNVMEFSRLTESVSKELYLMKVPTQVVSYMRFRSFS